jgi:molecular chaperone DnaK (HSP70)
VGSYTLGIDLGTLNSCVAIVQDGHAVVLSDDGRTTIPSAVALAGERELVGHAARRHAMSDPQNTLVATKRILGHPYSSTEVQAARERVQYLISPSPMGGVLLEAGGRQLTAVQVAARVLYLVRDIASRAIGESVKQAVISVPAHFNEVQRRATKLAAEYAGLEAVRLINEPTAAAFAYGYRRGENFTLAVYDLGGGTFDVTIMKSHEDRFEVVATDGDAYLGGEDLDHAVMDWLAEEFLAEHNKDPREDQAACSQMKEAAERAKHDLTELESTRIELPYLLKLQEGNYAAFARELTREKLEELCTPAIGRTRELCARCLESAGIRQEDIDAVLLVGGQTRMPAVRDAVRDFFDREPRRDINPDEVVAMGAALYGYSLSADRLRDEAEEAAEEAFAVALKQTAKARKVVEAVESLGKESSEPDPEIARKLSRIVAEAEALHPMVPAEADQDLPAAVEVLRREMSALQEKLDQVSDEGTETTDEEKPQPIADAVEVVADWLSRAERASKEAEERFEEAEEHAQARKVELTDVTSHALGIGSAEDLLSVLIDKNAPVPAEKKRVFTTNQDEQAEVQIRVFQGENPRASQNDLLGDFVLTGIEPAPRLTPKIQVTFSLDEDGILSVRAVDKKTGSEQGITVKEPLGLEGVPPEQTALELEEPNPRLE